MEDSDLISESYIESPADNTGEDLSLEGNNPKCFTKSKIELFQTNIKENHFMNGIRTGKYNDEEENRKKRIAKTILPNQDTIEPMDIKEAPEEKNMTTNIQRLKEKLGDYIDSSGGTMDAIEVIHDEGDVKPEENVEALDSITKNINNQHPQKDSPTSLNSEEDSAKRRLRELTKLDGKNCIKDETIDYPLKAGQALRNFMTSLSDYEKGEILDYKRIYFLGLSAQKVKGSPLKPYNYGYDDEKGDYKVILKDHIGYRFEVLEPIGKGSFGQALRCFDHQRKEFIALKIIRNKKKFQYQAGVEVKILKHLRERDQGDDNNIIKIKDYIVFRKHLCISFELLSIDLYEFIKNNNFRGVSLGLIRRFAIQILQALKFTNQEKIIHCDLKPENILLKNINKSGIKLIDFGSS